MYISGGNWRGAIIPEQLRTVIAITYPKQV